MTPTTNDRLLARSVLEAAVAEARRRRQVVRWTMLAFVLVTTLGIAVVLLVSQF